MHAFRWFGKETKFFIGWYTKPARVINVYRKSFGLNGNRIRTHSGLSQNQSIMAGDNSLAKDITFVTGNENKLREVQQILGSDFPHKLVAKAADLPEYQGEADTVSKLKCQAAFDLIKSPVVVEDTCLCFNAMKGLPGPYIKWFLTSIGPEGLHKMLQGFDDHTAYAMATLAYTDGEEVHLFKGITEGSITSPRGASGFGWDSCFLPKGYDKTYGEMTSDEKNDISHRKRAVEAMRNHFQK